LKTSRMSSANSLLHPKFHPAFFVTIFKSFFVNRKTSV
jgi:hypothetical protein